LQKEIFVFFLTERDWNQKSCYGNSPKCVISFLMHICGAKFQEHSFNISRDIAYSAFYHFFSCKQYDIKKTNAIFLFLKGLSKEQELFFITHTP